MPTRCCAPRCTNSSDDGYCFKGVPEEDGLRQHWIAACKTPNWNPPKSGRLCEVHFDTTALFRLGGKKLLKKDAFPTAFCCCHEFDSSPVRLPLQPLGSNTGGSNAPSPPRKKLLLLSEHGYSARDVSVCKEQIAVAPRGLAEHNYGFSTRNKPAAKLLSNKENYATREKEFDERFASKQDVDPKGRQTQHSDVTKRSRKYSHSLQCVVKTCPVVLSDLPEYDPTPMEDILIHVTTQAGSQSPLPLPETSAAKEPLQSTDTTRMREQLKSVTLQKAAAEKRADALEKRVQQLEEAVKTSKELLNRALGEDQQKAMEYGTTRGSKWSDVTIKKSLALRLSCGTSGYNMLRQVVAPFPSVRTLQERIAHLKFDPGVQVEVFECLRSIVPHLPPRNRYCCLVFDEMSIQCRVDLDRTTNTYVGHVTLPGAEDEVATKALAFLLMGIGHHWKQYVCYHFTPSRSLNAEIASVVIEILKRCFEVGLKVLVLVCDMGNRGLLSSLGFSTKKDEMIYSLQHPFSQNDVIYLMPDTVHVFKNLKQMLIEHKTVTLPRDIVQQYNLPSDVADMRHVEWLDSYQQEHCEQLKFAPKLKSKDIHATHFAKMRVSTATNVIHHQTAAALNHLASKGEGCLSMKTTAWLVNLLRYWFDLMKGRTLLHALSFHNITAYQEAIGTITLISDLFRRMIVGSGSWKASQTHVIICCEAMLKIQEHLLNEAGFQFFFPGRLTQDGLENGFSSIRRGRPKPSALDFKLRLRQLCIIGQDNEVSSSSYAHDGAPSLIDILLKKLSAEDTSTDQAPPFPLLTECDELSSDVEQILYRMFGYVVLKLRPSLCENCYKLLQDTCPESAYDPQSLCGFVVATDYVPGAQVRVSKEVAALLTNAEKIIWKVHKLLPAMGSGIQEKCNAHLQSQLQNFQLSTCHPVQEKLISRYLRMRLRQLSTTLTTESVQGTNGSCFGSRTMGSSLLADRFK